VATMLNISIAMFFVSVSLLIIAAALPISERKKVKKSLSQLSVYETHQTSVADSELSEPFANRVLVFMLGKFSAVSRRVGPVGIKNNIKKRLLLAGSPRNLDADKFFALKILNLAAGVVLVFLSYPIFRLASRTLLIGGAAVVLLFFFLPDLWLSRKIESRQKSIRLALPNTLDLLAISVEAGLGFDAALAKVVKNSSGPLAEEFFRMLQEVQIGTSRKDAFKNLGQRTNVPEFGAFIMAMIQADIFGTNIGKVLKIEAREMRIKRRQRAEEIAMKAPVKIVFPLILCIFPALMAVIVGPAVIRIYQTIILGVMR